MLKSKMAAVLLVKMTHIHVHTHGNAYTTTQSHVISGVQIWYVDVETGGKASGAVSKELCISQESRAENQLGRY
jgi:hypothetical protein